MAVQSTSPTSGSASYAGYDYDEERGSGWVASAGVLLLILGTLPRSHRCRDRRRQITQIDHVMQRQQYEPNDVRSQRLGLAIRKLAADLVEERRQRSLLERELRNVRARLAVYEPTDSKENHECQPLT